MLRTESLLPDIAVNWVTFVGEDAAQETEPLYLKNGRLTVKCSSSVWVQEMLFGKKKTIEAINAYFKQDVVKDISLRQ